MNRLRVELGPEIPKLGATENDPNPTAYVRFYEMRAGWVWYVIEYDGDDSLYGYVVGFEREYGCFNLSELESIDWPVGPGVRCDRTFTPTPMREVVAHETMTDLVSPGQLWRDPGRE